MSSRAKKKSGRRTGLASENYVAGAPYAERLRDFVAGDSSVKVSDAFQIAFAAVGKARVDLDSLTPSERRHLVNRDLRWERGPDGVLMWTPVAETNASAPSTPDCQWLPALAVDAWSQLNRGRAIPSWLTEWSKTWSRWGYRFLSVLYDSARNDAVDRKSKRPASSAANSTSSAVASLKVFFLEYLPNSCLGAHNGQWPTPEALLTTDRTAAEAALLRDDFWDKCCATHVKSVKSGTRSQRLNQIGNTRSVDVQAFLDFVSKRLGAEGGGASGAGERRFQCPFLPRTTAEVPLVPKGDGTYGRRPARSADKSCKWISLDFPGLSAWESFAAEYIGSSRSRVANKLNVISVFCERYLSTAGRLGEPGELLDPSVAAHPLKLLLRANAERVPNTLESVTADRRAQDGIVEFLEHILKFHCAEQDDEGLVRLRDFWNPFAGQGASSKQSAPSLGFETLRSAMPYAWVKRHREILVEGPHFGDWKWAQQALLSKHGNSSDWFEIDRKLIDEADPDCVWRERTTGNEESGTQRTFIELWSPVRWVTLLMKLNTALRTLQVRVLDSGESDAYRFDLKTWAASYARSRVDGTSMDPWIPNDLKKRNRKLWDSTTTKGELRRRLRSAESSEWSNGALRRSRVATDDGWQNDTLVYINTNKTADNKKEGAAKGFEVPLPLLPCPLLLDENADWVEPAFPSSRERLHWLAELAENTHWWLAKLRDWQEKYNPIDRRADWSELSGSRLMPEKSAEQYSMYRPACFLFREPSMAYSKLHPGPAYPVPDWVVGAAWWSLNKELQDRFASEGRTNADGSMIRLVKDDSGVASKTCEFDLHSIRVSIITALVVEGKVPLEIVQRLVGHSRILMTLYYTKLTSSQMQQALSAGMKRMTESAVDAEMQFLNNATAEQLRNEAAYLDEKSALAALGISKEPGQRPVIAWVRVIGGVCPVGAVARDTEGGLSAGCFNGGEHIGSGRYAPVTGGERTCPNCRWFVTRPPFLGELVSIFEVAQYRAREADERGMKAGADHEAAIAAEDEGHKAGASRQEMVRLMLAVKETERRCDAINEQGISSRVTMGNAYRLIRRVLDVINRRDGVQEVDALILSGGNEELRIVLEETTSEMLHLARITQHAEVFPELDPGKAILRASQIMARKLAEDGVDPWLILELSEDERCRLTNGVVRQLARTLAPEDDEIGFRRAVKLIDGPESIAMALGIKQSRMPEFLDQCARHSTQPLMLGAIRRDEGNVRQLAG